MLLTHRFTHTLWITINALEAGGNDNITALVVSVVEETEFENENWVLNEMIPYPAVKPLLNPSIDKEIRGEGEAEKVTVVSFVEGWQSGRLRWS